MSDPPSSARSEASKSAHVGGSHLSAARSVDHIHNYGVGGDVSPGRGADGC